MMKLKVFDLRLNRDSGCIDDTEMTDFLEDKEVLSFSERFEQRVSAIPLLQGRVSERKREQEEQVVDFLVPLF